MSTPTRAILVDGSKYGLVGGVGTLIDILLFNFFIWFSITVAGEPEPIFAKTLSTIISAGVTYLGHGFWTFRGREGKLSSLRTIAKFTAVTVMGLLIGVSVVGISHYVLGFQSVLANNGANLLALLLSAAARFMATRQWVFPGRS